MSKRTSTTLTIQVRLRIPPGSNTSEVLAFVRAAIIAHKDDETQTGLGPTRKYKLGDPIASLDTDSMIVKLEKKETVYL